MQGCDIRKEAVSDICNPTLPNAFSVAFSDRNLLLARRNVHKHTEAGRERFTFTLKLLISGPAGIYSPRFLSLLRRGNGVIFLTGHATLLIPAQEGSYSQDCMKDNTGMSLRRGSIGHYNQQGHAN